MKKIFWMIPGGMLFLLSTLVLSGRLAADRPSAPLAKPMNPRRSVEKGIESLPCQGPTPPIDVRSASAEPTSLGEFQRRVSESSSPAELREAVEALVKTGRVSDEDMILLEQILASAQEEELVISVLRAIAQRRDRLPVGTLAAYLEDPRTEVRRTAMRALGTEPMARAAIEEMAQHDPDLSIRQEAELFVHLQAQDTTASDPATPIQGKEVLRLLKRGGRS